MICAALLIVLTPFVPPALQSNVPVQRVDDDELERQLQSVMIPVGWEEREEREKVLAEILRRGGDGWIERLSAVLPEAKESVMASKFGDLSLELHLLTVIRRLQGRPDPLTVEVRMMTEGPYVFPDLPVLGVRLLHTKGETETFLAKIGGDYRGGRLGRWDLVLEEENGEPHVGVDDWSALMGGGMFEMERAGPGFVWGIESPSDIELTRLYRANKPVPEIVFKPVPLPMTSYRRPTKLGVFNVRAAYHATQSIADMDGHGDLIVHRSEPLSFEWKPRTIELTDDDDRRMRSLVNQYMKSKAVVLTHFHLPGYQGSKAETAHPLDRIFAEGWAAVPFMIDALIMESTPHERALLIAGLYSLTGMESPAGYGGRGALGDHTTHGTRVPEGSGVFSTPAVGTSKGKIRPESQAPFARRWEQHRTHIQVRRIEER